MRYSSRQTGFAVIPLLVMVLIIGAVGAVGHRAYTQQKLNTAANNSAMESSEAITPSSPTAEQQTNNSSETFWDVINRTQNQECDWDVPNMEQPVSGKLWTSGGKGHSSVTMPTTVSPIPIQVDVIFDETQTLYSWMTINGSVNKQGMKLTKDELNNLNEQLTPEQVQQADVYRQKMNFRCAPWTVDNTKFELPSNVIFN